MALSDFAPTDKAIPDEEAVRVGKEIEQVLERIPADHRVGFLFGMVLAMLDAQGLNETQVRGELLKGLMLAYRRDHGT